MDSILSFVPFGAGVVSGDFISVSGSDSKVKSVSVVSSVKVSGSVSS